MISHAACTFWLNILRFVNNNTGGHMYQTSFDIPRMITHNIIYEKLTPVNLQIQSLPELSKKIRFMFVRDPYSRLWSAWIDKFLLPDFWLQYGKNIAAILNFPGKALNK
ncbi:hypothetical protein Btru_007775 [Bulinus truncatus]|nr:hypothetical protein Btru_007775 [Bulinus truncatus]